jgi:hypothetical protein
LTIYDTAAMVIPPRFDAAADFMDGLAGVNLNGWWGFIDRDGQIVIAPQFNSIREGFIEGVAWVELRDGLNVYINRKGEILAVANEKRRKLSP